MQTETPRPLHERIMQFASINHMHEKKRGKHNICEKKDTFAKHFNVKDRIGTDSANGEVKRACIKVKDPETKDLQRDKCGCKVCHEVALKMIPLWQKDLAYYKAKSSNPQGLITNEIDAELTILQLCTESVLLSACPNLPMMYSYHTCEKGCEFDSKKLQYALMRNYQSSTKPVQCMYAICEYASGGDLKHWLKVMRRPEEIYNMFFQVFAGLYYLLKHFNITHNDLHWGNVLVIPCKRGGVFEYGIEQKLYHVPNMGWQFVLWDFGFARSKNKIEISKFKDYYTKMGPRTLVDYGKISCLPVWVLNELGYRLPEQCIDLCIEIESYYTAKKSLQQVIEEIFHPVFPQQYTYPVCETYNLNKVVTLSRNLQWLQKDPDLPPSPGAALDKEDVQEMQSYDEQQMEQVQENQLAPLTPAIERMIVE
jgi:serine/threonine protein kinase